MRPCPPRFMPCSSPGWHRMDRAHLERFVRPVAQGWSPSTYSHERYEPSFFASGEQHGTPEEGLDVGAVYLDA